MALQIQQWDAAKAKEELTKRLRQSIAYRAQFEPQWELNRGTLFQAMGPTISDMGMTQSFLRLSDISGVPEGDEDPLMSSMGINYVFRFIRFIHSQMSSNPPSVIPKPTSTELADRRAAKVADMIVQFGRKQHNIAEVVDTVSLSALTYGTGISKEVWDVTRGEALKTNMKKGTVLMSGDAVVCPVSIWNFFLDPEANHWSEVRYVFEKHLFSIEEAMARFATTPQRKERLEAEINQSGETPKRFWQENEQHKLDVETITVFEYWEKGLPWNGMVGRHVWMMEDGFLLSDMETNPMPSAALPYSVLTDVDVLDQVYGKSTIEYLAPLQDILNRLDSTLLDNIQAHGVVRMVLPDGAEIEDGGMNNDTWNILKVSGLGEGRPHFMDPPQIMPDMHTFRAQLIQGMESIAGVNESMFGEINRELSGFSVQTAINAGNMVRRRLFNKYTAYVESVFNHYIELIQKNWTDKRKVQVVGQEGALDVAYFSGADIASGFALSVEYGTSLSLDPASRREEITQLIPLFQQLGVEVDGRRIIGLLRLNELESIYSDAQAAERRQQEVFDEMEAAFNDGHPIYIAPEKNEDHGNMLKECMRFRMSATFKYMPAQLQRLIDKHIDDRRDMDAQARAGAQGGSPAAAGASASPQGAGGAPDMAALAGMLPTQ